MDRYNWKTSNALYEIFVALHLADKEITVTELSENMGKQLRIISEQIGYLEKEEIIISEKIGRSKYIKLNIDWIKEKFPKILPLKTLKWSYLFDFKSFDELEKSISKNLPPRQHKEESIGLSEYKKIMLSKKSISGIIDLYNSLEQMENENKKMKKKIDRLFKKK